MAKQSRRGLLAGIGRGTLVAGLGLGVAGELGLASPADADGPGGDQLTFGPLEPLVVLMQETPTDKLQGILVDRLRSGTDIRTLVAAGALANARSFGGEDYVGFHTMMAMGPAYRMAEELPADRRSLPVLKVLHRNSRRLQETGGRKSETLHAVTPAAVGGKADGDSLRELVRARDVGRAEQMLAQVAERSVLEAFNSALYPVQDNTEVHRVVMPYRSWDLAGIIGMEHALTMLRQSVRYCVKAEGYTRNAEWDRPRVLLPKLLEQFKLLEKPAGDRQVDDAWVEKFSDTLFRSKPDDAATAAASALADGIQPAAIGEAISLAANQLVLRDRGRPPREESPGKPTGSVHGDSIGVHASDSANAWRNMARVGDTRNVFACLILGAYQVAWDRQSRGGDFLNWDPLPDVVHQRNLTVNDPAGLLRELELAIRDNLQGRASAVVARAAELGHPARPIFDVLLQYAISEDGSLHAEKYYRTVSEEFASGRPKLRWRHLIGLARVTASEYGRPAPGYQDALKQLRLA